jgi:hypothetical protein
MFGCLSICLFFCCLFVCLSGSLLVCSSVCLCVCVSVCVSAEPSIIRSRRSVVVSTHSESARGNQSCVPLSFRAVVLMRTMHCVMSTAVLCTVSCVTVHYVMCTVYL